MNAIAYTGPHLPCLLNVGRVQSFVYNAENIRPWNHSPEPRQRELQRHNKVTGRQKQLNDQESC